jgi:CheY-like chemotaxis protein
VDTLESNAVKLRQILLNLISNALKYTDQGEVTVSARPLAADGEKPGAVAFAVQDTGIGIPPEVQERIFDAFYQVAGGYIRKVGGTGMGLAITSRLTALMAGTIELISTPGQGSIFTVTLPLKATKFQPGQQLPRLHAAREEPVAWTSPASVKQRAGEVAQQAGDGEQRGLVLAVDDNPDVIVLLKDTLKETPYTVVGVQDPTRVMELVEEMRPSAITLDVLMADVNGWQVLDQLKHNPATASIPVVMLTVIAEPTTGYVLGADDYLVKPFKKEMLLNTLQKVISSQKEHAQTSQ